MWNTTFVSTRTPKPLEKVHLAGLFPPACRPAGVFSPARFYDSNPAVARGYDFAVFARRSCVPPCFRPHPAGGGFSGVLSPACKQTGVFLPARFRYCDQMVMGIPLNVVFARRFRPVPVFARTSIALRNKAQRTASHRGASTRCSDAFVDDDDWRSRAGSSRACVPPVYLACTSSPRRAQAKRFRNRLCTAGVLSVNEGTVCRALLVGYKTPLFFWRTRR